jgi:hypothetical protein
MPANEPDFNEILAQIQEQELEEQLSSEPEAPPTDENVNEYILKRGSELLDANIDTINRLKNRIATAHDSDEINALANLIKSTNSVLATLTSITLQNKKDKTSKEIASNTHQLKEPSTVNNTMFIGTREDMLKLLAKKSAEVESVSSPAYDEEEPIDEPAK